MSNDNAPTSPAGFDLDGWLSGAARPTRSVRVWGRADLRAELDELEHRIKVAKAAEADDEADRAVGERRESELLEDRWVALSQEIADSALDIRIKALNSKEIKAITAGVLGSDHKGDLTEEQKHEIGVRTLAAAIVDVRSADGRSLGGVTPEQVEALHEKIGEAQMLRVSFTQQSVGLEEATPSSPFSRTVSTRGRGRD